MRVRVSDRQTLLDVALSSVGSVEGVEEIAWANGVSMTEELEDGMELEVPEGLSVSDGRTVSVYRAQGVEPATEASEEERCWCRWGGVGYMCVGVDFEVS